MKPATSIIMVVAKDAGLARTIKRLFPGETYRVRCEPCIDRVLERLESEPCDVLLVTSIAFKAGEIDGMELLEVISARIPATQILFLAAARDIRLAMSAVQAGSYQYARLPIDDEELRLLTEAALARRRDVLPSAGEGKPGGAVQIIGRSPQMRGVYQQIRLAAATDIPVLVSGETGTGKDLVAQEIHRQSSRSRGPFVPIHLGALPTELVASELFGHEKGAFTGAERRQGYTRQRPWFGYPT
ncbi:MAG TPA: sigma 54-interacting transcriptional regulator [Planctomycetota bacterium]|nr:sigma 54-interacting transcriptional regulator [Planctomycetota bacterium]